MVLKISARNNLKGEIHIPSDKSISHRVVMLSSIAEGKTKVKNFLFAEDCLSTVKCFQKLGINIEIKKDGLIIQGKGLRGLSQSKEILDAGNSGTTIRLISGILSGQDFTTVITGDESLQMRPMKRIIEPLSLMGAKIEAKDGNYPPLKIEGKYPLSAISYELPVASAQVKSAILLAGLYAEGKTKIIEKIKSRDHTERMLKTFGVDLEIKKEEIILKGISKLKGEEILIPGDFSSAAFLIGASLITKKSNVLIKDVGVNETRIGFLDVLKKMDADFNLINKRKYGAEVVADIEVKSCALKSVEVSGEIIPRIIDELPILTVIATQAEGETIISDAKELRVKETDRIKSMVDELRKMGADLEEKEDGIIIKGPTKLKGAKLNSYNDHRTALSLAVAGLVAEGETEILNAECINISFPNFKELLDNLK